MLVGSPTLLEAQHAPLEATLRLHAPGSLLLPEGDTLPGVWREGGNPAGLALQGRQGLPLPVGGWFRTTLHHEAGDLRRVRDPRSSQALALAMGGSRVAGEGAGGSDSAGRPWVSMGSFRYTRSARRAVRWAAVADPYGGTPFVWSDSTGGDWSRDDVVLGGRVGTRHSTFSAGVGLDATYAQGARRNDPRPLFRLRDLRLTPGLAWTSGGPDRVGEAWTLGVHLEAGSVREEGEIGYFAGDDPFVHRFRGHGTFDRTQLVRAVRTREGRTLGLGLQGVRVREEMDLVLAATLRLHADSIRQGIARPEDGGHLRALEGTLRGVLEGDVRTLGWAAGIRRGEGTDPVFRQVNVLDTDARLQLRFTSARPRSTEGHARGTARRHRLEAEVFHLHREDLAAETRWTVQGFEVSGGWEVLQVPSRTERLIPRGIGVEVGASLPLSSTWRSDRPTAVTPLVVRPEYLLARLPRGRVGFSLAQGFGPLHLRASLSVEGAHLRHEQEEDAVHLAPGGRFRTLAGLHATLLQR